LTVKPLKRTTSFMMTNTNTAPAAATLWIRSYGGPWMPVMADFHLADVQDGYRRAINNGKRATDLRILPVGQVPA
jgi:hypothetical protein